MIRRRKVPVKAAVALHGDNRLASVLMILIAVDRRVNARGSKAKVSSKANAAKQGSPKRGPIFLRNFYLSLKGLYFDSLHSLSMTG